MAFPIDRCRSCNAPVIWTVTVKDKRMPVDAEPSPDGNVELTSRTVGPPLATVHPQPPLDAGQLRLSHFATCPHAKDWKRS